MNNNFKVVCGTLAGFILGGLTVVGANQAIQAIQNTNIRISLNGEIQEFKDESTGEKQYPITYNDRTYLPLRNVAQILENDVLYDSSLNIASFYSKPLELSLFTGLDSTLAPYYFFGNNHYNYEITKDGKTITLTMNSVKNSISTTLNQNLKSFQVMPDFSKNGENCYFVALTEDGEVFFTSSVKANLQEKTPLQFYKHPSRADKIGMATNYRKLKPLLMLTSFNILYVQNLPIINSSDDYNAFIKNDIMCNDEVKGDINLFDLDGDNTSDIAIYKTSLNEKLTVYDICRHFLTNINDSNNFIQTDKGTFYYEKSDELELLATVSLEKDTNGELKLNFNNVLEHYSIGQNDLYKAGNNESFLTKEEFDEIVKQYNSNYKIIHSIKNVSRLF